MILKRYGGHVPRLGESVFVAENAVLVGDVAIGSFSSIWFGVVARADVHKIRIGQRTSIQDGSVLHVGKDGFPLTVGDDVVVGHHATLHGCTIADRCLIGIGSRVLNGAVIGEESIVAAGAVVTEGAHFEPRTLLAGIPAKPKRKVRTKELEHTLVLVERYLRLADEYLAMTSVHPH